MGGVVWWCVVGLRGGEGWGGGEVGRWWGSRGEGFVNVMVLCWGWGWGNGEASLILSHLIRPHTGRHF